METCLNCKWSEMACPVKGADGTSPVAFCGLVRAISGKPCMIYTASKDKSGCPGWSGGDDANRASEAQLGGGK
jgi:hypothetical protein